MEAYRVSTVDRMRVGDRSLLVAGPVDIGSIDALRSALVRVARLGPQTRLGLVATTASRDWAFDPDALSDAVDEIPAVAPGAVAGLAESLRARDLGDASLRVTVSGSYVAFDGSHGIADGRVRAALWAAVVHTAQTGHVPHAWSRPENRFLTARAIARTFGSDPRRLAQLYREKKSRSGQAHGHDHAAGPDVRPWSPSPSSRYTWQSADCSDELREWRSVSAPGATMRAVTLAAFSEALRRVGIPIVPRVHVLVDARRYLSPSTVCNGNFAVGLNIPAHRNPVDTTTALVRAMRSGLPLATMSALSAKGAWAGLRDGTVGSSAQQVVARRPHARLAFSDVGRVPGSDDVQWSGAAAEQRCVALTDPYGAEGITFVGAEIAGTRHLSVSFHDNVFDGGAVQRALDMVATDPVALLDATATARR